MAIYLCLCFKMSTWHAQHIKAREIMCRRSVRQFYQDCQIHQCIWILVLALLLPSHTQSQAVWPSGRYVLASGVLLSYTNHPIDHPPERARRSFTLIAKSLIVLANMSKFGQKEPWMEPMNKFLGAATADFKTFIEEFCSWDTEQGPHHEPQYQAALQIKQRLPRLSREGLPSLPFLLDAPTSLATLVDIWTKHAPPSVVNDDVDDCIGNFHRLCFDLKQKAVDCMANAETAQEPNSKLERQWQKMLSEQQRTRMTVNPFEDMVGNSEITALPQASVAQENYSRRQQYRAGFTFIDNSPTSGERRESDIQGTTATKPTTYFTNTSGTSFDVHDEYRLRQGARSRDGSTRGRFIGGRVESGSHQEYLGRV